MEFTSRAIVLIAALASGVSADSFNYRHTENGDEYGPAEWNKVSCNNLETCVSVNNNGNTNGITLDMTKE